MDRKTRALKQVGGEGKQWITTVTARVNFYCDASQRALSAGISSLDLSRYLVTLILSSKGFHWQLELVVTFCLNHWGVPHQAAYPPRPYSCPRPRPPHLIGWYNSTCDPDMLKRRRENTPKSTTTAVIQLRLFSEIGRAGTRAYHYHK